MDRSRLAMLLPELNKNGNSFKKIVEVMLNGTYVASLEGMMLRMNECVRNAFEKGIEEYVNNKDKEDALTHALENIELLLFTSGTDKEKIQGKFFVEEFFNFLREMLAATKHPEGFILEYFKGHSIEYQIELLKKYMRHIMKLFTNTAIHQTKMLTQFNSQTKKIEITSEDIKLLAIRYSESDFFKKQKKVLNPDLIILENYLALLMNHVSFHTTNSKTK
jgi:hypothetical protein